MEYRRGKNDKMSRWVWKAVEDKADKARIAKTEGERTEEREDIEEEEVRFQETSSWGRDIDSKDSRKKARRGKRLNRD